MVGEELAALISIRATRNAPFSEILHPLDQKQVTRSLELELASPIVRLSVRQLSRVLPCCSVGVYRVTKFIYNELLL